MKQAGKFGAILLALASATSQAQASDVDWKLYGYAAVQQGGEVCFFDAMGVAHAADGNVRVWTKCLSQKKMDNIELSIELNVPTARNHNGPTEWKYISPETNGMSLQKILCSMQ